MTIEVSISGMDEVERKLKRLGNLRLSKNAARRAARKAMALVRDDARTRAKNIDDPETAEKIWKNITVGAGKTRDVNSIVMRVGVRGGASFSNPNPPNTSGGDTRHWRWVELGSVHNPPTPFMRPALQNNIQAVTNSFAENFNKEIDKELAKL
ncbi:HK97-gp10 family putative phage morphogenesis protein [Acinetobacter towneri]|uniref:HK97 gp10 family phage protein n=1 Tax=Acinetobacter towneri TaxID=202956 RepID=A0AB35LXT1_9GAMM|nr:HK97-gp10 family putative phage morphogenesis protein [Acinetobacter towneri]MDM1718046.1 HK97 gp10 family phage protein [Acinetobacter towneri]MDM1734711.1 HK97 gp10 family phage protein [Acinetobacter towneri]MDM1738050.1 HK97 gp10 family phage protein [Acinetobacter towneri]MDM1741822.1 HK97 gp10 family phage protein [Acinetobacter towneri]MDM1745232.1 HK97 gp10 family phage protein [Acinetobacter towneri]